MDQVRNGKHICLTWYCNLIMRVPLEISIENSHKLVLIKATLNKFRNSNICFCFSKIFLKAKENVI
jgi:hypothetical protein